jgi:D-inositol-3-phosphate glycosyltransferase
MIQGKEALPASGLMRTGGGRSQSEVRDQKSEIAAHGSFVSSAFINIALLTGGGDKPYALGIAAALTSAGIQVDFIGSDDLSVPELQNNPRVKFYNLRGDQRREASFAAKIARVLIYYWRLIRYAAAAKPTIFHLLWNNKLEFLDRTLLMVYYKLLGKKIVFTAHNVNAGKRDLNDSWLNRLSLSIQYRLSDHIFVHSESMKRQLVSEFAITDRKVSAIPFGINNTVPDTAISRAEAKQRLGINNDDKAMLFFGHIAPYKGLEYLVAAFTQLVKDDESYRLIIAGEIKRRRDYWNNIEKTIAQNEVGPRITSRIEYIPDEEAELYFKAADVLILPYARVFQSGVLFLGYSFGLPVIAADIGTLKDEIIEGETGFVFTPQDSSDLAKKISRYFVSEVFKELEDRRWTIRQYANERYSWDKVAKITTGVYLDLLAKR